MSEYESKHTIPSTTIYLNAGTSDRVIDFVIGLKDPKINIFCYEPEVWSQDDIVPYAFYIVIEDRTQEDIRAFINKLNNIYPYEVDYDYTTDADRKRKAGKKNVQKLGKVPIKPVTNPNAK